METMQKDQIFRLVVTISLCAGRTGPRRRLPNTIWLQARHVAYLLQLIESGKIVAAGPFADGDDTRGMAVYRVGSLKEAKALAEADPKGKAGHLTLKWYTWLVPKSFLLQMR